MLENSMWVTLCGWQKKRQFLFLVCNDILVWFWFLHLLHPVLILNALFILHAGQLGLPPSREIILEHVVERKRMDDLAGSITDGRFHEQKVHHIDTRTWQKILWGKVHRLCNFFVCICGCSHIMALNSHCHKLCYQLKNENFPFA